VIGLSTLAGCKQTRGDGARAPDCGDAESCYRQAQALARKSDQGSANKEAAAEDEAKAAVLFQRGCELGSGMACDTLGSWFEYGSGAVKPDLPRAARLFEQGCTLKEVRACDGLAVMYREGRGVPKDPAMESKYRKLACALAPPMTEATFCRE
jgi:TPR repeat protein